MSAVAPSAPLAPPPAPSQPRTVALVGNPNVGKSTLFNALTGLSQRVANYPGVTVDAGEGLASTPSGPVRLVDLPGTYSLCPSAADEAIVERVLAGRSAPQPHLVLVVLDATNLRRNLFLLTEVVDLGLPTVVALNMSDEARRAGIAVPTERLTELLGVPVVETVATSGEGLDRLRVAMSADAPRPARVWRFAEAELEQRMEGPGAAWERVRALREADPTLREREVAGRYAWITEALTGTHEDLRALRARSERIDRVMLHPVAGPLCFLLLMALVFQSIFTGAEPLMGLIEKLFGWLGEGAAALFPESLVGDLLKDGVVAGVGAVVVFLPQILILFLFIGLLEDTGYMARAAFLVDRPLRALGLSGRSFIPLLSSFACAIPGVMATRTIPSKAERLAAILVAPLMTCSARLPVYTILIYTFVPGDPVWLRGAVMFGLYAAALVAGGLVALVVSRFRKRRGRELPLVVELPPYRRPSIRSVLMKLKVRGGDFLKRAGTVIFAVTVLLWVLMTFPRVTPPEGLDDAQAAAYRIEQSWGGQLGHAVEPAIRPLGYDWKIGVGLIASFAAREAFVSAMGVIYAVGEGEGEGEAAEEDKDQKLRAALQAAKDPVTGQPVYTLATVASLLAFYVFALMCGSTVAVVRRETASWGFALGQLLLFAALAWAAAFVVYRVGLALGWG